MPSIIGSLLSLNTMQKAHPIAITVIEIASNLKDIQANNPLYTWFAKILLFKSLKFLSINYSLIWNDLIVEIPAVVSLKKLISGLLVILSILDDSL